MGVSKEWNDFVWSSKTKEGHNPQTPTPTTIKTPSKNHLGDAHSFGGGGSIREQVPLEDVTESATTTKRIVPKDRFGQEGHAWGSTSDSVETPAHTDERESTENRQEANVQRTTRKSRPSKVRRTERPNVQSGIGSNDFALVDNGGAKLELDLMAKNAQTSTTTTTTDAEDERPNWGQHASSSSRPRAEESNSGSSGSNDNREDNKPNWG